MKRRLKTDYRKPRFGLRLKVEGKRKKRIADTAILTNAVIARSEATRQSHEMALYIEIASLRSQ